MRGFLVGLALAVVLLAGCSGRSGAEGTLAGHLYGVGGPAPGLPRPWPGTVTLTGPGVHQDVSVGADGSYSGRGPPACKGEAGRRKGGDATAGSTRGSRPTSADAAITCCGSRCWGRRRAV